jgi:hypothetical protein
LKLRSETHTYKGSLDSVQECKIYEKSSIGPYIKELFGYSYSLHFSETQYAYKGYKLVPRRFENLGIVA